MRVRRRSWAVLVLVAALALMVAAPVGATNGGNGSGLWEADYVQDPPDADCGPGTTDLNGFCTYDDNPVALGVAFTTAEVVRVTGVRIYRVDDGAVTGTLWNAAGENLATGVFGDFSGSNGWQDLVFASPVLISPGEVYVASYYAPKGKYAYEYDYFTNGGRTVGPITALRSSVAQRNGVYVYGSDEFPTDHFFKDPNYWVTPLWEYPTPQSKDDCKQGGWENLTDDEGTSFANQGDCVSYVATGGTNKAKVNASTDQLLLEAGALG